MLRGVGIHVLSISRGILAVFVICGVSALLRSFGVVFLSRGVLATVSVRCCALAVPILLGLRGVAWFANVPDKSSDGGLYKIVL